MGLEKSDYSVKNVLLFGVGVAHLKKANEGQWQGHVAKKLGHGVLGALEMLPVLSQVISIIEAVSVRIFNSLKSNNANVKPQQNKPLNNAVKVQGNNNKFANAQGKLVQGKAPNKPAHVQGNNKPAHVQADMKVNKADNLKDNTANAFRVFRNGDAAAKTLGSDQGVNFFIGSMKDTKNPDFRGDNPDLFRLKKGAGLKELPRVLDVQKFKKTGKLEYKTKMPKVPGMRNDTKLTSLSLISKNGYGRVFARKGDLETYDTGFVFDATKTRHNQTAAYYKSDGYTSWRPWKAAQVKEGGKVVDKRIAGDDLLNKEFRPNILDSYSDLKDHAQKVGDIIEKGQSKTAISHNELLAHVSKEALVAISIRSELAFTDHNSDHVKFRAICEKIKVKNELGRDLPILVLNMKNGPREFTPQEQKAHFEHMKARRDNFDTVDFHGVDEKDIEAYFKTI